MVTTDEYRRNNHYKSTTLNMVNIKKDGKIIKVSKEEYYNDETLISHITGTVSVVDKRDGLRKRVSVTDFNKYTYYIATRQVLINFYDSNDNFMFVSDCNINTFLKNKNMPVNAFKVSYRANGTRLYNTLKDGNPRKTDIINKGWYQYKGWYAIKV